MNELKDKLNERFRSVLMENDEMTISVADAARATGFSETLIRNSILQGKCPFGIGYGAIESRSHSRVSKLALINWMERGTK